MAPLRLQGERGVGYTLTRQCEVCRLSMPSLVTHISTSDPAQARRRPCRIYCRDCSRSPIPVLHPLPDIAMHVIESPGIGFFLPYRMCLVSRVFPVPGILSQLACVVAKAVDRRCPSPCGIFPLCLRRQAIR